MPEVGLKRLHMANSLEALNKQVNIDCSAKPQLLIKSAKTVLNKAELSDKEKDEELAYVYFMRYFAIIKAIQKHEDFKKDKSKFENQMITSKEIRKIIGRAENLSESLKRRYDLLAGAENKEKEERRENLNEIEEKIKKLKTPSTVAPKISAIVDGFISCKKLYSLVHEKSSSYLVLDIRPKEAFSSSCMKVPTVINIPEENLKPGLTANKASRELDERSRLLWTRRHGFDYIIICDWSTESLPLPTPIAILIDAMEKWDPGKSYKAKACVLGGGYEMFSLTYPMLISNPVSDAISRTSLNSSINNNSSINKTDTQFNFTFPDLDTGFLATPSPTDKKPLYPLVGETINPPSVNRNLKPKITPTTLMKGSDSSDQLFNVSNGITSMSGAPLTPPSLNKTKLPPDHPVVAWNSSSSSSTDTEDDLPSNRNNLSKYDFGTSDLDSRPIVPSRELKPQELLESVKANKKDLDEEKQILEQSYIAERDIMEKLHEMEETQKVQKKTSDDKIRIKLAAKVSQLKDDLDEKKQHMEEMEKRYASLHQQNKEMQSLLSQLFAGQLKIDNVGTAYQLNPKQNEEKEALRISEENKKSLAKEVEELRRKRKEKEKSMNEEMQKKREIEEKRKQEEAEEIRLQFANAHNAKNRENLIPDFQTGGEKTSTPTKKRGFDTYKTKLKTSPRSSPVRGGSNIKRSHSALNLSQLQDENGIDSFSTLPNFDRSLKPLNSPRRRNVNAARQRNFEPKYGSVPPTKTGLKNLGNTCYMNCIVQNLSNTFLLAKFFFDGLYTDDLNPESNQRGEVAEEFGAVVRALWCSQFRSISMWDLKSVVGRYHKPFQGCDQHDSHEFLIKLMDWLHDDMNLVTRKYPKMEEQNFDNIPDSVAAQSVMEKLQLRDDSVIREIFYGLHRSVIYCHTCRHESLTFEPFSVLTLSFPDSGKCSLKDMLYDFYKETRIEYKCSKCKDFRICSRKFDIWKLPPVLIIHLNRFEHDVLTRKKQSFVDFPLENLNISQYTSGPNVYTTYDLYGVSNHYGTIDGGHYTAYCKSPHKTWYKFDDHEVYDLSKELVRTSNAYILFYEASSSRKSSH